MHPMPNLSPLLRVCSLLWMLQREAKLHLHHGGNGGNGSLGSLDPRFVRLAVDDGHGGQLCSDGTPRCVPPPRGARAAHIIIKRATLFPACRAAIYSPSSTQAVPPSTHQAARTPTWCSSSSPHN